MIEIDVDRLEAGAAQIRHRIGGMEAGDLGWDLRQEVMDLCEIVGALTVRLRQTEAIARKAANEASCLANGVIPD